MILDTFQAQKFQFLVSPTKGVLDPEIETLNVLYATWFKLWGTTMRSLEISSDLKSESFTRQDLVGGLFYQGQCIAVCTFRFSFQAELSTANDSYFQHWGPDRIQALFQTGDSLVSCGNFCVERKFRGMALGVSVKDLLAALAIELFLASGVSCLSGAVRINRGMNVVTQNLGAATLAKEVDAGYRDAKVDLVSFYRDAMLAREPTPLINAAQEIWGRRRVLRSKGVSDPAIFLPQPSVSGLKVAS